MYIAKKNYACKECEDEEKKSEREGRNRRKGGNYIINCGFVVSCNDKLDFIKKLL